MRFFVLLFVISVTTFFHELGHFLALTAYGVEVKEFAVGFGPALFTVPLKSGAEFAVRLFPFGGMTVPEPEAFMAFMSSHPHKYALVLVSGMAANVVSGIVFGIAAITVFPDFGLIVGFKCRPITWVFRETLFAWIAGPSVLLGRFLRDGRKTFQGIIGPLGMFGGVDPKNPDGTPLITEQEVKERSAMYERLIDKHGVGLTVAYVVIMTFVQMSGILAAMNALPFFPLDGGKLVYAYLDAYLGSGIANAFLTVSFGMLIYAFLVVSGLDLKRLFGRKRKDDNDGA